jgi:uncharacterized protein with HEPN domain
MTDKDRQIILSILNYIDGINKTHTLFKNEKEIFLANNDYQYSVAFAILQIGELVGRLEIKIKDKIKIKSLRNRIVLGYGSIDIDLLWEISHSNIKELRNELEHSIGL